MLFVKAFWRGLEVRERLLGAPPDTSVYLIADSAFGGMLALRFGSIAAFVAEDMWKDWTGQSTAREVRELANNVYFDKVELTRQCM